MIRDMVWFAAVMILSIYVIARFSMNAVNPRAQVDAQEHAAILAEEDGAMAFDLGISADANPYSSDADLADRWFHGWSRAKSENNHNAPIRKLKKAGDL